MKDLIERNDLFGIGEMFDDLFRPVFVDKKIMHMKTDIKETKDAYELDIDLPGFKKNEIDVTLRDGYLTVSAKKEFDSEKHNGCECEENGKCDCENEHKKPEHRFVRRERVYASTRSYYVGTKVGQEQIKAKYEDGVLTLVVPKEKPKQQNSTKITID